MIWQYRRKAMATIKTDRALNQRDHQKRSKKKKSFYRWDWKERNKKKHINLEEVGSLKPFSSCVWHIWYVFEQNVEPWFIEKSVKDNKNISKRFTINFEGFFVVLCTIWYFDTWGELWLVGDTFTFWGEREREKEIAKGWLGNQSAILYYSFL